MTPPRAHHLPRPSAKPRGRAPRNRQRGVLHILFLVFAILGVSLWGISEFLLTAEKESRQITAESAAVVTETKRILLNYALNPPPAAVSNAPDCGQQSNRGCYNYYYQDEDTADGVDNPSAYAKYSPLTLPCPDLATDDNLDGASDPGPFGCGSSIAGALESETVTMLAAEDRIINHRFGRLPWREEREDGLYARGFGNRDLRDGSASRLWYGISRNVAPCITRELRDDKCPYLPNPNLVRNAHNLLTLQTGWLTVEGIDENGDPIVLSDRVAAVVISPGAAGNHQQRPDEDILLAGAGGPGANPIFSTLAAVQNYLEGENADGDDTFFAYGGYGITLLAGNPDAANFSPTQHEEDHLEYITIDELVAALGENNPAEETAQLLESFYQRHGHYPDPAAFHSVSGENKPRPPGLPPTPPSRIGGTVDGTTILIRQAQGVAGLTDIPIRIADLPPVYLAPGFRFPGSQGNFEDAPGFPFSESLARMKTHFLSQPLIETAGSGNYRNLFQNAGHAIDRTEVYGLQALTISGEPQDQPEFTFQSRAGEIAVEPGNEVEVILSAPLALNSNSTILARGRNNESVPPGGVDVVIPAGTRLRLQVGDDVFVQFPAGLQLRGQRYRFDRPLSYDAQSIREAFPEIASAVELRDIVFAAEDSAQPSSSLIYPDNNNRAPGVGAGDGGTPGNIRVPGTRYAIRPQFSPLQGNLVNNHASEFDPNTGFLQRAHRDAGASSAANSTHRTALIGVLLEDIGGGIGAGIPTRFLSAEISLANPRAFRFPATIPSNDLVANNRHLAGYFSDGAVLYRRSATDNPFFDIPQFPLVDTAVQNGTFSTSGPFPQVEFPAWPFSRVYHYADPPGGLSFPECPATGCPYAAGFWVDSMVVRFIPDFEGFNQGNSEEVSGVELTEQTLLPAKLIDRGGNSTIQILDSQLSGNEAVAGRTGLIPYARAATNLPENYFNHFNVEQIRSMRANAVAHLYAPIAVAAPSDMTLIAFPPPGRPAPTGFNTETDESNLFPLPPALTVPNAEPIQLPIGTRIIAVLAPGRENWLDNFRFPAGAIAMLPPETNIPVNTNPRQRLPDGSQAPSIAGSQTALLPSGGMLLLSGTRPIPQGDFGEMLEFEVREGAIVQNLDDGNDVRLHDGALLQPLTGRGITPLPVPSIGFLNLNSQSRIRGRFLRRPHIAIRTGEEAQTSHPLALLDGTALTSRTFPAGTFLGVNQDLEISFDEDTQFLFPPNTDIHAGFPNRRWGNSPSNSAFGGIEFDETGPNFFKYLTSFGRFQGVQEINLPI